MTDERADELLQVRDVEIDEGRWVDLEGELGFPLPTDYKQAMQSSLGEHNWNEFLSFLDPFSTHESLSLVSRSARILEAERESRAQFPHHWPYPIFPEIGGVFPWGITDNGDVLYWLMAGTPEQWPTLIRNGRGLDYEVRFLSCTAVAHHIAKGTIDSIILPDDLGEAFDDCE